MLNTDELESNDYNQMKQIKLKPPSQKFDLYNSVIIPDQSNPGFNIVYFEKQADGPESKFSSLDSFLILYR